MANAADGDGHWVISAEDRAKHRAQFEQLKPVNGFVSGDQVKPLLLKSGLPMPVLGHVWNLADINGDGKMDLLEFSIAIHLIRKRLQGVALPKTLPATLKGEPVATPSPPPSATLASAAAPPTAVAPPRPTSVTTAPPQRPVAPPTVPSPAAPDISQQRSVVPEQVAAPVPSPAYAPVPAQVIEYSSQKHSVEAVVWAIPQSDLAKYYQMFQAYDQKAKGYLTGLEARDILSKSGLSVKILAQIWNLSDIDGDGRLTRDEFVIAMFYVDFAKSGKPVPSTLPPEIVPPSCRKPVASEASPVEKPASLPRPTAKPPTDATRVPAIQPPSAPTGRRSQTASPSPVPVPAKQTPSPVPVPAKQTPAADPFGMNPLAFEAAVPVANATVTSVVTVAENLTSPPGGRNQHTQRPAPVDGVQPPHKDVSECESSSREHVDKKQVMVSEEERLRQIERENEERRRDMQEQLEREKEEQRKLLLEQMEKEKEEQRRLLREQLEQEKEEQRKLLLEMMEKEREEQRKKLIEQKEAAKKQMEMERQLEWEQQRKVQLDLLKSKEASAVEKLEREMSKLKVDLASLDDKKADYGGKADKGRMIVSDFTSAIEQMRVSRDQKIADINRAQLSIEDCNKRTQAAQQDQLQLSMQIQTFMQCHAEAKKVLMNSCNAKKAIVDQLKEQLLGIDKDTASRLVIIDNNCSKLSELKLVASDLYAEIQLLEDEIVRKRIDWNATKNEVAAERVEEKWRQDSDATEKEQDLSNQGYTLFTAVYEFVARSDDELTLKPGDLVWIKPENIASGTGWSVGRSRDGREGCFPESYVQCADAQPIAEPAQQQYSAPTLFDDTSNNLENEPGKEPEVVAATAEEIPTNDVKPVIDRTMSIDTTSEPVGELYVAVYSFESAEDGDLSFKENDVISVTQREGDWWTGNIGNKSGIFPANFVKKMESRPPAAVREEDSPKSTPSKKPEIATVIASYEATSSEQLALQVGQMIQIRRKTDSGWWEGELQVRGQKRRVGWFPANFVKVLGPGGMRLSAEASGKIPSQPPQVSPAVPATSTTTTAASSSSSVTGGVIEQAVALYDYQSQQPDELNFVKGNVINVLSKQHSDWWMGELNGRTGIFPANFVGPA